MYRLFVALLMACALTLGCSSAEEPVSAPEIEVPVVEAEGSDAKGSDAKPVEEAAEETPAAE